MTILRMIMIRQSFQTSIPRRYLLAHPVSMLTDTTMRVDVSQRQQQRGYLGQAGNLQSQPLSAEEEDLLKIAQPRSEAILAAHRALPNLDRIRPEALGTNYSSAAATTDPSSSHTSREEIELEMRRKRLVYRSKQRGWLEVDLLLGTWASEHVHKLTADELDQYEAFVNLETIDIYNIITLRAGVPDEMRRAGDKGGIVEQIQAWAKSSPLGQADPETYKTVKMNAKLI